MTIKEVLQKFSMKGADYRTSTLKTVEREFER